MFVCNSAKYSDLGQPFGYLKASTALNCVNLFVMPYNYPVLLPLLGKTEGSVVLHFHSLSLPVSSFLLACPVQNFCHLTFVYILISADDLIKVHKFKPTLKWRQSFENYLKTMPPYYYGVSRLGMILYPYV